MSDTNNQFDDFDEFDDFDDFDEDSSFDDDGGSEPIGLTAAQERKLEKFQANVKRATRVLNNPNAPVDSRVKAAEWLGESGEPTAITALRQAYRNDPEKKVQRAAEKSLGMFRALEEALNDASRADEVQQILQDIIFEGRMGGASGLAANIRRIQIGLVVSFVVLMLVGVLAGSGVLNSNALPTIAPTFTPFLSPTPQPTISPVDFVGDLFTMHDDLVFDAELLAERYQLAIQGDGLGCDVTTFRAPTEYFAPSGFETETYPLVTDFIGRLNTIRADLEALRTTYDDACASGTVIPVETANEEWNALIPIQASLNTDFVDILSNPDFIPGEAIATPTPRPSPTPFPTATVEPSVINSIILQVQFNVDEMNQPINGYNNRLIQYWTDLEIGGQTDGCRDGTPDTLPTDYSLTEQQRTELPADLLSAVDAYNLAMQLSRDSWALFEAACLAEEPSILQGKTQAELAKTSFDEANVSIGKLTQ